MSNLPSQMLGLVVLQIGDPSKDHMHAQCVDCVVL